MNQKWRFAKLPSCVFSFPTQRFLCLFTPPGALYSLSTKAPAMDGNEPDKWIDSTERTFHGNQQVGVCRRFIPKQGHLRHPLECKARRSPIPGGVIITKSPVSGLQLRTSNTSKADKKTHGLLYLQRESRYPFLFLLFRCWMIRL